MRVCRRRGHSSSGSFGDLQNSHDGESGANESSRTTRTVTRSTEAERCGRVMRDAIQLYKVQDDTPVALLLIEIASEPAGQPEAMVAGAWAAICWTIQHGKPEMPKALFAAGCLDAALAVVQPLSPMERISRKQLVVTGVMAAVSSVVERGLDVGLPVVARLLEAGYFEIIMSALTAYQLLGDPSQASAGSVQFGVLSLLDILLHQAAD